MCKGPEAAVCWHIQDQEEVRGQWQEMGPGR